MSPQSKDTDLVKSIEKHFQGSKSLFNAKWNNVEKLIYEGLSKLGFKIKAKNHKTPFGEIDLLTQYKNQMFMIEIKAVSEIGMLDRINRSGQKTRLVNVYNYLISNKSSYRIKNLRAVLIVVERKTKEVLVYLDYLNIE